MNVATAAKHIQTALSRLEADLGEPVFDEWALVEKTATAWKLLQYGGSRKQEFMAEFANDIAALRDTFDPAKAELGQFAFSHEGYGSGFDAHICAGTNRFVLLNNTAKSTGEITSNPNWKPAQIHFAELLEAFIADPLRV
jgi:hypothetical protein